MRTVVLKPIQAKVLLDEVFRVIAPTRIAEKGIGQVMDKLMLAMKAEVDDSGRGTVTYKKLDEDLSLEFDELQISGARAALVQAANGFGQQRARSNEGYRKVQLRPIAKALGVEKSFIKDTEPSDKGSDEDVKVEYDDAPEAKKADGAG